MKPQTKPVAPAPLEVDPLQVAVLGCGRIGLVTAAGLASFGHRVTAIDVDEDRIEKLCRFEMPFHEEGLEGLVRAQSAAHRLAFTSEPVEALQRADLVFIAVGTPSRTDGSTDLAAIDAVRRHLVEWVRAPALVVLQSTVPVGTARRLQAALCETLDAGDVPRVLSQPGFLREGSAVLDFMRPDRLLIGDDAGAGIGRTRLVSAFAPLVAAGVPVIEMDTRSAELAKCAADAMLAARVSFMNEIAAIATATGADVERVRAGVGSDPRIGTEYLRAGLGYGGTGLAKGVATLRETARRHNLRSDMLLATERVNSRQRCWAFDAMRRDLGGRDALRGLRVAIWGLAFKPGSDDVREAPSLALVDRLWRAGAELALFDPLAMDKARDSITPSRRIAWSASAEEALRDADVMVLSTEWPEFVSFAPARLAEYPRLRAVYDGRNALDLAAFARAGVRLVQVGRPAEGQRTDVEHRSKPVPLLQVEALQHP